MKTLFITAFLGLCFTTSRASLAEIKPETGFNLSQPSHLNLASDEIGGGKSQTITSLILPGVGLWRVTKMPATLGFLPVCYGLVGFGTMTKIGGKVAYNNYMDAKNPLDQDMYFEKALTKKENGSRMLGLGIALWIVQAGWTYMYGSYNDIYRDRNSGWKDKITFLPGTFDPQTKSISVSTIIKL